MLCLMFLTLTGCRTSLFYFWRELNHNNRLTDIPNNSPLVYSLPGRRPRKPRRPTSAPATRNEHSYFRIANRIEIEARLGHVR